MISMYRSVSVYILVICERGYGPQEFVNQGSIHCTVPGAVDGLSLLFHVFNFGRPSDITIMNYTIELILLVYFSWHMQN